MLFNILANALLGKIMYTSYDLWFSQFNISHDPSNGVTYLTAILCIGCHGDPVFQAYLYYSFIWVSRGKLSG